MSQDITEERNPASTEIDRLPTLQILQIMNQEDGRVVRAVSRELPQIAAAVDAIVERVERGGRLIYAGAGTSGRLGMLAAAACAPAFTADGLVTAIIAGGDRALRQEVADAEDSEAAGHADLALLAVMAHDAVVGLSAGGSTPYVLGALAEARAREALTIGVTCNPDAPLSDLADMVIAPIVGPEVIAGCTHLKAATAEKMVLDMLSTGVMVRLGKTYGNLAVELQPTSAKLRRRAVRIVAQCTQLAEDQAAELLATCGGQIKTAILSYLAGVTPDEARIGLAAAGGRLREALRKD